jgi:hypothetical protein
VSSELIDDTNTVLDELNSRIGRFIHLEDEIEKRAKAKTDQHGRCRVNCHWVQTLIKTASAGRNVEWLEGRLDDLESEGFIQEELKGVPEHIINHAIALCKQAIANQTPSLV